MRTQLALAACECALLFLIPAGWMRVLIAAAVTHWLFVASHVFNFLSNRHEVLYLRAYGPALEYEQIPGDGALVKAFTISVSTNKRLQHQVHQYLRWNYDVVGLLAPPRSDVEKSSEELGMRMVEAKYLLRTIDDADWKASIQQLIASCSAVIVECTVMTESLRWEIVEVLRLRGAGVLVLAADETDHRAAMQMHKEVVRMNRGCSRREAVLEPLLHATGDRARLSSFDTRFRERLLARVRRITPRSGRALTHVRLIDTARFLLGWSWMVAGLWVCWELLHALAS